jgi:hypothetical protein
MIFPYTVLFLLPISCGAQQNGIFNGGPGHGWARYSWQSAQHNSIFNGHLADGYTSAGMEIVIHSNIFHGQAGDGYASSRMVMITNQPIFAGGSGDGFDQNRYSQQTNHDIFSGGHHDGVDTKFYAQQSTNQVYAGSGGDGYSSSLFSKLIWTGSHNTDWLVASNWNLNRVPTLSDQVIIPTGTLHSPLLKGKWLINKADAHIYTCKSFIIKAGAEINATNACWLENYGDMLIHGKVMLKPHASRQHSNYAPGIITISPGGQFRIEN